MSPTALPTAITSTQLLSYPTPRLVCLSGSVTALQGWYNDPLLLWVKKKTWQLGPGLLVLLSHTVWIGVLVKAKCEAESERGTELCCAGIVFFSYFHLMGAFLDDFLCECIFQRFMNVHDIYTTSNLYIHLYISLKVYAFTAQEGFMC